MGILHNVVRLTLCIFGTCYVFFNGTYLHIESYSRPVEVTAVQGVASMEIPVQRGHTALIPTCRFNGTCWDTAEDTWLWVRVHVSWELHIHSKVGEFVGSRSGIPLQMVKFLQATTPPMDLDTSSPEIQMNATRRKMGLSLEVSLSCENRHFWQGITCDMTVVDEKMPHTRVGEGLFGIELHFVPVTVKVKTMTLDSVVMALIFVAGLSMYGSIIIEYGFHNILKLFVERWKHRHGVSVYQGPLAHWINLSLAQLNPLYTERDLNQVISQDGEFEMNECD